MRSDTVTSGNPWPQDMAITVEEDNQNLIELLWVRELYALQPIGGDLPPQASGIENLPPTKQRLRRNKQVWEQAWTHMWHEALARFAGPGAPSRPALPFTAVDPLSDTEVAARFSGPRWRDQFDATPFGPEYDQWVEQLSKRRREAQRLPLELHPERRSLNALITAWQRGLTTVVTIPSLGTYTRTLGPTALLVTEETRADRDRYTEALAHFAVG